MSFHVICVMHAVHGEGSMNGPASFIARTSRSERESSSRDGDLSSGSHFHRARGETLMADSTDQTSGGDMPNVVFILGDNVGWGTSAATAAWRRRRASMGSPPRGCASRTTTSRRTRHPRRPVGSARCRTGCLNHQHLRRPSTSVAKRSTIGGSSSTMKSLADGSPLGPRSTPSASSSCSKKASVTRTTRRAGHPSAMTPRSTSRRRPSARRSLDEVVAARPTGPSTCAR